MQTRWDAIVVGGGFYGTMIALSLQRQKRRVLLVERGTDLLSRASYNNQARVHNGYHYPRSWRTALSSRVNFPRFTTDFADCIEQGFEKYYAIARRFSKVTARQFRRYFERIGAHLEPAPERVRRLFQANFVDDVFLVTEYAFDAVRLRKRLSKELATARVDVRFESEARRIWRDAEGLRLAIRRPQGEVVLSTAEVYNCTYANLNQLLAASHLPLIPLRQELTEMALVAVPEPLRSLGITLMCGPFFSVMPFPPRGLHSLSHVRFTPHDSWEEGTGPYQPALERMEQLTPRSRFTWMVQDASRYLPLLQECRYHGSLWEIKTLLPRNDSDDGRPILFRRNHGLPGIHCVLGGKIDNIYDLMEEIDPPSPGAKEAA